MAKKSAGILVYRIAASKTEVLLAHPGGPYWAKKDIGIWSIPKGEYTDEEPLGAAKREFLEETGVAIDGDLIPLTPVIQKDGKIVYAWAVEADPDISGMQSNLFEMEWPPRSGKKQSFPEVDRVEWWPIAAAKEKIIAAQSALLDELVEMIGNKLA
jgi:predicted NUDIX family NTP pyrophosphohydrolase